MMGRQRAETGLKNYRGKKKRLRWLVEFKGIERLSLKQYRSHVRNLYDGPAGAMLAFGSVVSLHEPLVGQLIRSRKFDVTRFKKILDVGSGAGQILGHLLKATSPETELIAFDLSQQMLRRARQRLNSTRPSYLAGDLTQLPFPDNSFDCITCGWVLEHLPDPLPGLCELRRVLRPGGSIFLLATEDTVAGALTSRAWKCRTYNRRELQACCEKAGLHWCEQLWLTPLHRLFRMGGILVEATTPATPHSESDSNLVPDRTTS